MEQNNKIKKQQKPLLFIILSVFLLIVASVTIGVYAKYVAGFSSSTKTIETAQFCFLTNFEENDASSPYPVYVDTISFVVKNYDEHNVTDSTITYSVTVSTVIEGETVSYSLPTQPLTPTPSAQQQSATINYKTSRDGDYVVTIASNTPFAKTIVLYFRVNTHYADSFYTVNTDNDGWVQLDIYTGASNEDIDISFGGLQPDNTSEFMSDWLTENGNGTLEGLQAFGHYTLIFFGEYDPATPFVITQGENVLIEE